MATKPAPKPGKGSKDMKDAKGKPAKGKGKFVPFGKKGK